METTILKDALQEPVIQSHIESSCTQKLTSGNNYDLLTFLSWYFNTMSLGFLCFTFRIATGSSVNFPGLNLQIIVTIHHIDHPNQIHQRPVLSSTPVFWRRDHSRIPPYLPAPDNLIQL